MNVEFHHEAYDEVIEAMAFYEERQEGLGVELWKTVRKTLDRIGDNPTGPERITPNLRRESVPRFPFSFDYGIKSDTLWVVAVAHHSRREGYWRRRV